MSDQAASLGYPFNTTFGQSAPHNRPQSASYYARNPSDDLGRSVQQHKDLHKGEFAQATLAKVFDDPHMRPKVLAPHSVNKPDLSLTTADIEGAKSRPKDVPARPRDTNPNSPLYILATPNPEPNAPAITSTRHNALDVSDIDRARPRPQSASGRNSSLSCRDIEGAYPSWRTEHKAALAGSVAAASAVNPDVKHRQPARPRQAQGAVSDQQEASQQIGQQHAARMSSAARAAMVGSVISAATASSYEAEADTVENNNGTWGSRPSSGHQPRQQQQQQQQLEQVDTESMVAAATTAMHNSTDSQTTTGRMPPTDALGNPIGRADKRNTPDRHKSALWQANTKAYHAAVAAQVAAEMAPSKATVQQLWSECRKFDREGCGKLTPQEMALALARSGLHLPPARMAALVIGMADPAGLLPYKELSKVLLRKTWGVQPAAASLPPKPGARPASAVPWASSVYGQPPAPVKGNGGVGTMEGINRKCRPVSAPASRQHGSVGPAAVSWADQDCPGSQCAETDQGAGPDDAAHIMNSTVHAAPHKLAEQAGAGHSQLQQSPSPVPACQRSDSIVRQASSRPQSASAAVRHSPSHSTAAPAQDKPHRRQPGTIEELTGVKAGDASQYFPYKAHGYWFGGNDGEGTLDAERLAWNARNDCSRSGKIRQPFLGDGKPLDSTSICSFAGSGRTASVSRIPDNPTVSSALKSGTLTAAELSVQVAMSVAKHAAPWQQRHKAAAAVGEPLIAAAATGRSIGSTLKPAGAAAMVLAAGVRSRPTSASARLTAERHGGENFGLGSVPLSGSCSKGMGSVRLQRQQMRDDIAAVRCLY